MKKNKKQHGGKFKKGNPGGPGGAREGAGRKPDEFKAWLKKTIESDKGKKRFKQIMEDHPGAETLVTQEGVEVPVRASGRTYLTAFEIGNSYIRSKAKQEVEHSGAIDLGAAGEYIKKARKERGLE